LLTAMKGTLVNTPLLRSVPIKGTNEKAQMVDFAIMYQRDKKSVIAKPRCVAWRGIAEKLATMKAGDEIEFLAKITHYTYKTPDMDKSHNELAFSILALDEIQTLCKSFEAYLGIQRTPNDPTGIIFQPMRGRLFEAPSLSETSVDGKKVPFTTATIRFLNGRNPKHDIPIHITAYNDQAKQLVSMKKNEFVEFVGLLDVFPYKSPQNHVHMELGYRVIAIDREKELCSKCDSFLQEKMGITRHLMNERI